MKFKRLLALLLAALCLAALLPGFALAATSTNYNNAQNWRTQAEKENIANVVMGADTGALVVGNNATLGFSIQVKGDKNIKIDQVQSLRSEFPMTSCTLKKNTEIAAGSTEKFYATLGMATTLAAGTYDVSLRVYFYYGDNLQKYHYDIDRVTITKYTPSVNVPPQDVELPDSSAVVIDPAVETGIPAGAPGEQVIITLPLANNSGQYLSNVTIWPEISTSVDSFPFEITSANMTQALGDLGLLGRRTVSFSFLIAEGVTNGLKTVPFKVGYYINGKYYEYSLNTYLNIVGAVTESPEGDDTTPLVIVSKNSAGQAVSTPTGDAGDRVTVVLPIKNRSSSEITNIEIYPQLSSDPASFPFEIESTAYDRQISSLAAGATKDITYSFRLSDKATSGVKAVKYSVIYRDKDAAAKQIELTSYVNVRKGYAGDGTAVGPDGEELVVQPKIIITSYQMSVEKVYAGDTFDLTMTIQNASDTDTVKNLKLTFSDEAGKILPAQGGSNTVFVRSLAPAATADVSISLQTTPDAESKAHPLTVKFDYNNAGVNTFTSTESLSIPVNQELRVTMDEPQIYVDGATVGASFYGSVNIYNRGKSQVYNVSLKLESENDSMRLEQGYYGGNMQPGASSMADISIIPLQSGDLVGNLVVQFEDEYGEVYEVKKEFTAYVQEPFVPDDSMNEFPIDGGGLSPEDGMGGGGLSTGAIIGIVAGAVAVVAVVTVIIVKKKRARRERELEA